MKSLQDFDNIYFIGVGGIGMSALVQYFAQIGKHIAGYDRTPSDVTQMLEAQGISIHFEDNITLIDSLYKEPSTTLVIYTPAIPKEHSELNYFLNHHFTIMKRSEALGLITEASFCLAVAGTHGKSTTSCLLAHILVENNAPVSAFLGAISENFNSNWVTKGKDITVVEADEFDRSFLRLSPNIACITAMDSDHLDIYGSEEAFYQGFIDFTKRLKPQGKLIIRKGLPIEGITYGINDGSDYQVTDIEVKNGAYHFTIRYFDKQTQQEQVVYNCLLRKAGEHNLLNAVAAVAMGHQAGYNLEKLAHSLSSFKGVKRRFSYHIANDKQVYIDDYAHHPTELNALHQGVRQMHPSSEATIIFQPHLYSRTRDFAEGFADSLTKFDRIVLLDIYPARELPIEGITAQWLFDKINNPNKYLIHKSEILNWLTNHPSPLLITAGAGDIGMEVDKITHYLLNQ